MLVGACEQRVRNFHIDVSALKGAFRASALSVSANHIVRIFSSGSVRDSWMFRRCTVWMRRHGCSSGDEFEKVFSEKGNLRVLKA